MYNVELELQLALGKTWPNFDTTIVNCVTDVVQEDNNLKIISLQGQVDDLLVLTYRYKDSCETIVEQGRIVRDQSIKITNLRIDGIKISLNILQKISLYTPNYRQDFLDYCKESNIAVDYGPMSVLTFWHAGNWQLCLPKDFWDDYHLLMNVESDDNFSGNSSESIREQLQKLKTRL